MPALITDGRGVGGSARILRELDGRAAPERRLYPADPERRTQVEELEDLFDRQLGPATRRIAYSHLLPHRREVLDLLSHGVPAWERHLVRLLWPFLRSFLRRGLRIDAAGVERSRARVHELFELVASRLTGPFLVGDRFSAADLTFAALSAGVLAPPEYGAPVVLPQLTASQHTEIEGFRAHPAGQFALRLYRQERRTNEPPEL